MGRGLLARIAGLLHAVLNDGGGFPYRGGLRSVEHLPHRLSKCPRQPRRNSREDGSALVELTLSMVVLLSIATFGFNTLVSGFTAQNWTIAQAMTDAQGGIESALAQRWVFSEIKTSGRWPQFPLFDTKTATIGQKPSGPVTAQVKRTLRDLSANGTTTYALESYVLYQNGPRNYCKLSRVIRSE
jgi:hypothetical protein